MSDVENLIFLLFLSHNLILQYQETIYTLFHYENSKQRSTWTNLIYLLIRYWSSRLYVSVEKFVANLYSFLVIGTTLASDNPSRFRKILLERIGKLIMTIDDKIRYENLQYDVNRWGESEKQGEKQINSI